MKETMPSRAIIRGLKWIHAHASADLETVSGQKDHFPTESESDVEAALTWLERYTKSGPK